MPDSKNILNIAKNVISIEQESILDSWVLWGSKWELKDLLGYQKLPQIKKLYKELRRIRLKGYSLNEAETFDYVYGIGAAIINSQKRICNLNFHQKKIL